MQEIHIGPRGGVYRVTHNDRKSYDVPAMGSRVAALRQQRGSAARSSVSSLGYSGPTRFARALETLQARQPFGPQLPVAPTPQW